ncbi:MAG TPA: serine/threonine-protein kinase [Planctomycetota bacterium]|nr:serine/threonine-protein kinase [Planctomycetota bacterium]
MTDAGDLGSDLPDELADRAGLQLMAARGSERGAVLDALLAAHPQYERALRRIAADFGCVDKVFAGHEAGCAAATAIDVPDEIGGHRVIRRIGAGAFGAVYLCAQERPVSREVAVKVVRPGAAGPETLRRFAAERQLLAALNHPTITVVFDAGELPDGRPYFVMEYVDGLPMRRYCDEKQLTVDARVRLFLELCRGVEHAHGRGIVHRDLKPANVLVVERETGPVPKIIDFGIAKVLSGSPTRGDVPTEAGRVVGTPGYMSPEQALGHPEHVDSRADVFALGVMLYELLTGELPWARPPESTDSEPPRPSVRVASDPTSTTQAERRQTSPQKLVSRLRGDLDAIVLKALAHERRHRYASAREFAADLERHLRGEQITARPTHVGRRVARLLRRHRVAAATAVAGLSLVLGTWISLHFAAQADERGAAVDVAQQQVASARTDAQRMSTEAEAAARALLARANDRQMLALPASAPVRQALAQEALAFYERFLRERPAAPDLREGRARALETLARVFWSVGQYAAAIDVAGESIEEAEALLVIDPQNIAWRGVLAHAHRSRARALRGAGRDEGSPGDLEAAVAAYERCYAAAPRRYAANLIGALLDQGSALVRDDQKEARLAALQRAVAVGETNLGEGADPELQRALADACGYLANLHIVRGDPEAAAVALTRAEELLAGLPDDPRASTSLYCTLASLASARGDAAAAIAAAQKGIDIAERWREREPDRPAVAELLARLHRIVASQHSMLGEHESAANASRAVIDVVEARVARFKDDPAAVGELANCLTWHAYILFVSGHRQDLVEAEHCARRSLEVLAGADPSLDRRLVLRQRCKSQAQLGLVLDGRGDPEAPAHWQRTVAAIREFAAEFGVDARDAFEFTQAPLRLGAACIDAGRTDAAGEALAVAEELLAEHGAEPDQEKNTIEAQRLAARLALQRGDLDGAAAAAERLPAVDSGWRGALAGAEVMTAVWRAAATEALRTRAIACNEAAIAALQDAVAAAPTDLWVTVPLDQCRVALAELLADRGDHDRARELLAVALPALARAREEAHANCLDEQLLLRGRALYRGGR